VVVVNCIIQWVWHSFGDTACLLATLPLIGICFFKGKGHRPKKGPKKMEVKPALALPEGLELVGCERTDEVLVVTMTRDPTLSLLPFVRDNRKASP
jgi:hypothetical protein